MSLVDNTKGTSPATPTIPTDCEAATAALAVGPSADPRLDDGRLAPPKPRQVIAVSVSKGPSAFFNLARKFLATDDACDFSALEGAIVSAVDAAHLLEQSQIATIVQIQTSYVAVEPKKRREHGPAGSVFREEAGASTLSSSTAAGSGKAKGAAGTLRRARIVITVRRTAAYEAWLADHPLHEAPPEPASPGAAPGGAWPGQGPRHHAAYLVEC